MPRRARLDAPGTLHHVMVREIERREIVKDVADRRDFVGRLGELCVGSYGTYLDILIIGSNSPDSPFRAYRKLAPGFGGKSQFFIG